MEQPIRRIDLKLIAINSSIISLIEFSPELYICVDGFVIIT